MGWRYSGRERRFQSTSAPAGTEEPHRTSATPRPYRSFNPPPPPRGRRNRGRRAKRAPGRAVSIHLRPRGDGGTKRIVMRHQSSSTFQSTSAPAGTEERSRLASRRANRASFQSTSAPAGTEEPESRASGGFGDRFQSTSAPAGTEELAALELADKPVEFQSTSAPAGTEEPSSRTRSIGNRKVSIHLRPRGDGGTAEPSERTADAHARFNPPPPPRGRRNTAPQSPSFPLPTRFNPPPPPRGRRNRVHAIEELVREAVSIHLRPRGDGGTVEGRHTTHGSTFQSTSAPAGTEEPGTGYF